MSDKRITYEELIKAYLLLSLAFRPESMEEFEQTSGYNWKRVYRKEIENSKNTNREVREAMRALLAECQRIRQEEILNKSCRVLDKCLDKLE